MKTAQEKQGLKTKITIPKNGYVPSMQIKQKLMEGENVNMETEIETLKP